MTLELYLLDDDKNPVQIYDLIAWAKASARDRTIAKTTIGRVEISTIFLGTNHSIDGQPLLFETMAFRDGEIEVAEDKPIQLRCSTRDEAFAQHLKVAQYIWQRDIELIEPAPLV